MAATIITLEDLRDFKIDLLEEIKKIIQSQTATQSKKWLKSTEVRKLQIPVILTTQFQFKVTT